MWTHVDRRSAALLGSVCAVALLVSCSGDAPTAANDESSSLAQTSAGPYAVCHRAGTSGTITRVTASELAAHRQHGDYFTTLYVSHDATRPDDGAHFRRIGDALEVARAGRLARGELRSGACRITISVGNGVFQGSAIRSAAVDLDHFPFVVDVPDITLRGALVMKLDADGRATGNGVDSRKTTLRPAITAIHRRGSPEPVICS